jgi:hypothetical protein
VERIDEFCTQLAVSGVGALFTRRANNKRTNCVWPSPPVSEALF